MGYYYASPVAADRKVFIASEEGVVVVLEAGDQLNVLARNKLDGAILATPAIVDGKIYFADRKSLVHVRELVASEVRNLRLRATRRAV